MIFKDLQLYSVFISYKVHCKSQEPLLQSVRMYLNSGEIAIIFR